MSHETEVNREELLFALQNCTSLHTLKFLGEVLRVQSIHKMPHTLDEEFMAECREAYVLRFKKMKEKEDGVRQREVGSVVQEHEGNGGEQAASVSGERSSAGSGVQRGLLDSQVEEGSDVHEPEVERERGISF